MKRFLSILVCCAMLLGVTSVLAEEPTTVTAIWRLPATFIIDGNPIIEAWGQRTNTVFEIEAPPISNYTDRLNVVMASGDIPDIVHCQNPDTNFQQWSRDELFLDLTPYFNAETMPNAFACLTADELAECYVDGKLYALPRVQTKPYDCIIYRGDWLEKLGLEIPTTVDEFAAVMKAFATMDPDGNGKDDTYGTSLRGMDDRNLINAFGVKPTSVADENGEYTLMGASDAYLSYLDWLRGMYIEGSIEPEWYLSQSYEDQDMFYAGKIGAIYTDIILNHLNAFGNNETFKAANPDGYLVAGPSLSAMKGEVQSVYYPPQVWGVFAINAESENIEQAIKILDDGYTDECATLLFAGMEGVTYTSLEPETRVVTATPEQSALANHVYASAYLCINYQLSNKDLIVNGGTSATPEELERWMAASDYVGGLTRRVSYLGEGSIPGIAQERVTLQNNGVNDAYAEMRTKYICGQITREELDDYIKNQYLPAYAGFMALVSQSGINK